MKNHLKSKVVVILIIITCCILVLLLWWLYNMVDNPNPIDP